MLLLCLSLSACAPKSAGTEFIGRPEKGFSYSAWDVQRGQIPHEFEDVDIVEATFTKDGEELGRRLAKYIGAMFITYPRFSHALADKYSPTNELMLLTCLLGTKGSEIGSTGVNNALAFEVFDMLGKKDIFITKEQVEATAASFYGEDVTITHQNSPQKADDDAAFVYHEDLGLYTFPEQPLMWYLPVLLGVSEKTYNSWDCEVVFVRYADAEQNSFFGLEKPIARWEIETYINFNISEYKVYKITVQEIFGDFHIEDFSVIEEEKNHG